MSGPNAPPTNPSGRPAPVRPAIDAGTNKPMGAERVPISAPALPRVSHTPPMTMPPPANVPLPRPRPDMGQTRSLSPDPTSFGNRFDEQGMMDAGRLMREAIGRKMAAGDMPTTEGTGMSREDKFAQGKAMLARAMAGMPVPAAKPMTRGMPSPAGEFQPSQELSVEYQDDPSVKFDKKGKAKPGTPEKVNRDTKSHNLRLYDRLSIDPSYGKAGVQPEINKLIKKAKDTPWLLTREEDAVLSSLNDRQGVGNRSIEPEAVRERFKQYGQQRLQEETEQMEKDYGQVAKKREKAQKKDKAETQVQDAIDSAGKPAWMARGKMPTQEDVKAGAAAPAEFSKRFPEYEQQAEVQTKEEGDE